MHLYEYMNKLHKNKSVNTVLDEQIGHHINNIMKNQIRIK